jgi:hypothetical protein
VLTNAHVITESEDEDYYYFYDLCMGGIVRNVYQVPEFTMILTHDIDFYRNDGRFDYAFMNASDVNDNEYIVESNATYGNADSLIHGDDLTLLGFPAVTGSTITSTSGSVAGFDGTDWIKTDALAEFGSSGGGAFDANGNLVGIVSEVATGELNSFTFIQNINAIFEDAFGTESVVRDYDTLYTAENVACIFEECYQFGEGIDDVSLDEEVATEDTSVDPKTEEVTVFQESEASVYDDRFRDDKLIANTAGRILLQVEQHGEAWYMHPELKKRFYMKDGPTAYQMMRLFSLGITDADLSKIDSVATSEEMLTTGSACKQNPLANRLRGRILLQAEQHGEAWYVHPDTCKRVYMKDGEAAYVIMRLLSLGITDSNLKRIPSDSL